MVSIEDAAFIGNKDRYKVTNIISYTIESGIIFTHLM